MKRIAIAAAAAFLLLGTAQAQQAASPLYGEIGYTMLNAEGGGADVNPHALRAIIGYDLHRYFAVEGMLAFGVREDSFFDGIENVDVKLKHAYGLFVKPKYDFGNIEAFGRLGWVKAKVDASCPSGTCSGQSESDFAYGLGVNYRFNPKMHVGIDWMRYQDKNGLKLDGWTIGFGYRF
jgi:opacity protein-like surface antigen